MTQLLNVGIKALTLLAPLPRSGVISLSAPAGHGCQVLMVEIIHRSQGRVMALGAMQRTRHPADFANLFHDGLEPERVQASLIDTNDSVAHRETRIEELFDACEVMFKETGDDIFCVIDVAALKDISSTILDGGRGRMGVTIILFEVLQEQGTDDPKWRQAADVVVRFSTAMAKKAIYPAIDAAHTFSRAKHPQQEVIRLAKQCLQDGDEQCRSRLEMYLSQPFDIAEFFTGIPGNRVAPDVVFENINRLIQGDYNHMPLDQLRFIGALPTI